MIIIFYDGYRSKGKSKISNYITGVILCNEKFNAEVYTSVNKKVDSFLEGSTSVC